MHVQQLYQNVTASIIKELETGTIPWTKPWKDERPACGSLMPHNRITGRAYSGINVPILWSEALGHHYPSHEWLTYRQALSSGAQVRKGEKSVHVVFASQVSVKKNEEEKRVGMLRVYPVFNASQVDNLPALPEQKAKEPIELLRDAEHFIEATEAKIEHGGNRACYVGLPHDTICLPMPEQFKGMEHYYATALHELCHNAVIGIMPRGLRWSLVFRALTMRVFGIIRALRGTRGADRRAGTGLSALPERRREREPFPSSAYRRGCRFGWSRRTHARARGRSPLDRRRDGAGPSQYCGEAYAA